MENVGVSHGRREERTCLHRSRRSGRAAWTVAEGKRPKCGFAPLKNARSGRTEWGAGQRMGKPMLNRPEMEKLPASPHVLGNAGRWVKAPRLWTHPEIPEAIKGAICRFRRP